MLKEGRSKDYIKELFESWGYSKTKLKKLWDYIEKQEANKDVVTGGLNRDKAADLLGWAKTNLIGKKTFEHPDFNGKVAKFVRNSITENSSYGELFELKSEILKNIDDYLTKDLTFAYEEPVKGKMRGFYKATTSYKGEINEFKGRTIELQFAINPSQELVFYFIKLI